MSRANQGHGASGSSDQSGLRLEDEYGCGIALTIERDIASEAKSARQRVVGPGKERTSTKLGGNGDDWGAPGRVVVGGYEIGLGSLGDRIAPVIGAVHRSWRKARDRSCRKGTDVAVDHGWASVRNSRASQNRETLGESEAHWTGGARTDVAAGRDQKGSGHRY